MSQLSRAEVLEVVKQKYSAYRLTQPKKGVASKVRFVDEVLYLNVNTNGMASSTKILNNDLNKAVGVTNFELGRLQVGKTFIADSFRVKAAAVGAPNTTVQNSDYNDAATLTAALQNTEFRFAQGNEILINMLLGDAEKFAQDDFRELGHMPIIESVVENDVTLNFPTGVTGGTVPTFISIVIRGIAVYES